MHEWRDHDLLRRALEVFGLGSLGELEVAPPEIVELAERRVAGAGRARLRDRGRAAGRDRERRAGRCATSPAGTRSFRGRERRPRLRPPRRPRGSARAARGARGAARPSGRSPAEPWLAEVRPRLRPDRELSELADTRDHQGVVARVETFRYADAWELAGRDRPLLVVLDRVTDPRNLGRRLPQRRGSGGDRASSSRRTARPSSPRRSRAPRPGRSSTSRSRSSRTSRATSRR